MINFLKKMMLTMKLVNSHFSQVFYLLIALVVFLSACASTTKNISQFQPVNPDKLIPVAAEFVTTTSSPGQPRITNEWRLLRDRQRVELIHPDTQITDVWMKSVNELWFYQKVFIVDQQVIEYSPSDLAALGVQPQWLSLALAVDPQLLQAIGKGKAGKPVFGYVSQHFTGEFQGVKYHVTWLPELAIAARVKYSKDGISTITEMKKPYRLVEAPWTHVDSSRYRLIDFSDLGDMERDPFVARMQGQLPGTHHHSH